MGAGVRYVVWDYLHVPSSCRMHDRRDDSVHSARVTHHVDEWRYRDEAERYDAGLVEPQV